MNARYLFWLSIIGLLAACMVVAGCGRAQPGAGNASPNAARTAEVADMDAGVPMPASAALRAAPTDQPAEEAGQGVGPGLSGDKFDYIEENAFLAVADKPLSTFSIDVDTASYSKARMYLMQNNALPPRDSVRIEEFINYFDYAYPGPTDEHPFAVHLETAACPWRAAHRLVRVGIQGRQIEGARPSSNLVFLIDVSGSMDYPNKLPLLKNGLGMLVRGLGENDRVAIVVYAGAAGLVLPSTTGDQQAIILSALDRLHAGGSTNGGEGIQLAYQTALDNYLPGGVNRVILCSDGDFNVGVTSTGDLVRLAETNARKGVHLSVLGFGVGNHNDAMLEQLSNKADGNYAFIDTELEARKVLVDQLAGTLVTIAKDVKIQVEFNPANVAAYRLIGYENRKLADRDFNDDTKDAGEIGAGHSVTALYEIVPVGAESDAAGPGVDPLKYQQPRAPAGASSSDEMLTVKLRYKLPDAESSNLISAPLVESGQPFGKATPDFQFAASVAAFAMLLRGSEHAGEASYNGVLEIADAARGDDAHGYRNEFIALVQQAQRIAEPNVSQYKVQHTPSAFPPADSGAVVGLAFRPRLPLAFWLGMAIGMLASVVALALSLKLLCWRPIARQLEAIPAKPLAVSKRWS